MTRVASLFLPQLPIERLRRAEPTSRSGTPPEPARLAPRFPEPIDDDPGACSVPRSGGWRPGARWAQEASARARSPLPALWGARPTILVARTGQRDVVTAACPIALDLGLAPGMPVTQARALVPDFVRYARKTANLRISVRLRPDSAMPPIYAMPFPKPTARGSTGSPCTPCVTGRRPPQYREMMGSGSTSPAQRICSAARHASRRGLYHSCGGSDLPRASRSPGRRAPRTRSRALAARRP